MHKRDDGFTLLELVVAVGILSAIVTSVAAAFIVGLRTVDVTGERLADSFDAQLVTRYLAADVQSAASSDIPDDEGRLNLLTGCDDSDDDILRLFSPPVSDSGATAARYELRAAGTTKELVRHHCDLATSTTPRSVVVAHDLSAAVAHKSSGIIELVITTPPRGPDGTSQVWTISSQPRPGRSLAMPALTSPPPSPGAAPVLRSLEIRDDDRDGFVEKLVATFDANVACTGPSGTCLTAAWTLAGTTPSGASLASVSVSARAATLSLSGHSETKVTSVPAGFTVSLSSVDGGISALSDTSLRSEFKDKTPEDKAAPALVRIDMLDDDTNGRIDQLHSTFTEALAASTDAGPWTLTDVPSGGAKRSVVTAGSSARLLLAEGSGAADTAVGLLRVSLAASRTGIRDAGGNEAQFADAVPADKAAPVPVSLTSANAGVTAGYAEQGDTVTVTFSEVLATLTTSAADVTLSVANGDDKPVMLSMPGLSAAAFQIGASPNYLPRNGGQAVFNGSTLARSASAVTVTLGPTVGTTRTVGSYVAGQTAPMTPGTSLRDLAGNAASGSILPTVRFF